MRASARCLSTRVYVTRVLTDVRRSHYCPRALRQARMLIVMVNGLAMALASAREASTLTSFITLPPQGFQSPTICPSTSTRLQRRLLRALSSSLHKASMAIIACTVLLGGSWPPCCSTVLLHLVLLSTFGTPPSRPVRGFVRRIMAPARNAGSS